METSFHRHQGRRDDESANFAEHGARTVTLPQASPWRFQNARPAEKVKIENLPLQIQISVFVENNYFFLVMASIKWREVKHEESHFDT